MTLGKAGGIIAILGGLLALAAAIPMLMLWDAGSAFGAISEETVNNAKLVLGGSSILVIVFGAIALAKPRIGAVGLILIASGAVYTGVQAGLNLFTLAMALPCAGGLMALFTGSPSPLPKLERSRARVIEWNVPPPPANYEPPPPPGAPVPPPPWERG